MHQTAPNANYSNQNTQLMEETIAQTKMDLLKKLNDQKNSQAPQTPMNQQNSQNLNPFKDPKNDYLDDELFSMPE